MKNLLFSLALSTLFLGSAVAAENNNGKAHCKKRAAMKEKILEHYDANKDGKLDESERAAAKAGAKDRIQARIDKLKTEKPELFAKIDKNGDGSIDREKAQAARQARKNHGGDKGGNGHTCKKDIAKRIERLKSEKPELFAKLDKNGDGTLSQGEIQSARQMRKNRENGERNGVRKQRQN